MEKAMATTLGVKIEDETLERLKHLSDATQRPDIG